MRPTALLAVAVLAGGEWVRVRRLTLLLAVLGTLAEELRAQEIQVPVDEAGVIQVITAELARRLGLFADVEEFREARLFELPDGTFVLEVTSNPSDGLQRERRLMSPDDAAAFRRDVTARVSERAPTAMLDQSGRVKLLATSMILGLGYYGWATAEAFDPDDSQTAVALYMMTAAGCFVVPFLATKTSPVSDAVATMALWGATRGPIHGGLLIPELGDAREDNTKFAWSVFIGATEAVAGGVAAHSLRMTSGRAELTGVGGDIGMGTGFLMADLLKLDERFETVTVRDPWGTYTYEEYDRTLQSLATLTGMGLGVAGGYLLGGTEEWTRGDAAIFRNVTMMASLAGFAVGDIIQQPRLVTETWTDPATGESGTYSYYEDDLSRTHTAAGLIGVAAGAALGRALVTGRDFSTSQGTLLSLTPLAGALIGLGLAYVATPENDHSELYLTASALGAGAGFAVLYPAMARQAKAGESVANLQLSLNPLAAARLLGGSRGQIPLGLVRYRF